MAALMMIFISRTTTDFRRRRRHDTYAPDWAYSLRAKMPSVLEQLRPLSLSMQKYELWLARR